MNPLRILAIPLALLGAGCSSTPPAPPASDPLPSWRDGPSKTAITAFVERVVREGPDFVPPAERIATFDNDGTLWSEQPLYFQAAFAIDRVKELAPKHPEWKTTEPFASILRGDVKAALKGGVPAVLKLVLATHAGMTSDAFAQVADAWLATAKHPRFKRRYAELVYQPMLELLTYLRANGFKTYIASGGGVAFLRRFAEATYGIPPEQVIGSRIVTSAAVRDGVPVIVRKPKIGFVNDKAGKPVGIHEAIGRRPIAAFGNSDGDLEMLQWTAAGSGPRLCVIVRHTDAEREWRYDRNSHVGRLDRALDQAAAKGWTVVDMKQDWTRVYPD